jgi:hypothetical protein
MSLTRPQEFRAMGFDHRPLFLRIQLTSKRFGIENV